MENNINPFGTVTSTLRQRGKQTFDQPTTYGDENDYGKTLKKLDLYPKTKSDVQTKTSLGGIGLKDDKIKIKFLS
jgi:hypothetical protein